MTRQRISEEKQTMMRELRKQHLSYTAIGKELGLARKTVRQYCSDIVIPGKPYMRHWYNTELFEKPTAVTYYLLGAFISDGNISKSSWCATLASCDLDWLETIRDLICPTKPIPKQKGSECYILSLSNKFIIEWLIRHACVPNKSLTVKFPNIPCEYVFDFIRGVFDGDGCVTISQSKHAKVKNFVFRIVSGSRSFATSLAETINTNDIHANLSVQQFKNWSILGNTPKDYHDVYCVCVNGSYAVELCETMYAGATIYMERKFQTFQKYLTFRKQELENNRVWPKDRKLFDNPKAVIKLLKTKTYGEVAKMFGITDMAVIHRLRKLGLYKPKKNY